MPITNGVPTALMPYCQWVLWVAAPSKTRPGKTDKIPIDPRTGRYAGHNDPAIRMTGAEALAALPAARATGVGFVFTREVPFFCIDVDNALHDGVWSPVAQTLCNWLSTCFIEVSYSGKGLHIIGTTQPFECGEENKTYKLDLYGQSAGHFIALTGHHAQGDASRLVDLSPLIAWPGWSSRPVAGSLPTEWTACPSSDWSGPADDEELIRRMLASKPSAASVLGSRATVQELWAADSAALSRCYPDNHGREFNWSDADAALCSHLAFWAGKDCERMDRLFRVSGLMRDKWERPDYMQSTILKAVAWCKNVYSQPAPESSSTSVAGGITGTSPLCSISEQPEYFKDCVYVADRHRVWVPDGRMLKPEVFKIQYGSRQFMMDAQGNKTSDDAFKCFTQSQAIKFPKAATTCFRPELPAGVIFEEENRLVVNTYRPIATPRISGDPSPFTDLLARMLPNERDRSILLSYLAAMVQNPGVKFQWWPVIQGVQGNGKSAIIRCMEFAIGRRYSHLPNVESMAKTGNQFNAWIEGKLFVGIEEIYVNDRRDFLEAFKATVTNDRLTMEGKGVDQVMGDNRANGIMCTNHKDGVPIGTDNRRYAIFYTAQQSVEDKQRDGMTGAYFPDLYDWFNGRGGYCRLGVNYGYAVVNDWLRNYTPATEFNPARLCQEAPHTSSTVEAVRLSLGIVEQEAMEAHESGLYGFCGDWISSTHLNRWLTTNGLDKRMPRNKRRGMLQSLGYERHEGLPDGRVHNPLTDGGFTDRPTLYCRRGSASMRLRGTDIVEQYQAVQRAAGGNPLSLPSTPLLS